MSDRSPFEDPFDRVFRASFRPLPPPKPGAPPMPAFVPGRGYLEIAVALAAFAILAPVLGVAALAAGVMARRRGNPRWLAAVAAACWCGVLGVAVRMTFGAAVFP